MGENKLCSFFNVVVFVAIERLSFYCYVKTLAIVIPVQGEMGMNFCFATNRKTISITYR